MSGTERVIILVKAAPHPSRRYQETVCCAGVTPEGEWRRLYPVRFRHLTGDAKFSRWDIVEYKWHRPRDDPRAESRRVEEQSLTITGSLPRNDHAPFLDPLLRPSYADAAQRGETLTLVRPKNLNFRWRRKSDAEVAGEKTAFAAASAQGSLLDEPLKAFEPCPYHLRMGFEDAAGPHHMTCGDWETSATFFGWRKRYGEAEALRHLRDTYERTYAEKGVALAMGTVAKRPNQWLLLGIIRMDEVFQPRLL
jgi:hypothetical protein